MQALLCRKQGDLVIGLPPFSLINCTLPSAGVLVLCHRGEKGSVGIDANDATRYFWFIGLNANQVSVVHASWDDFDSENYV